MLEEVGRKNGGGGGSSSTRLRIAKERLTEAEALRGGVYEEAGSTEQEGGEKIVGQDSSPWFRE